MQAKRAITEEQFNLLALVILFVVGLMAMFGFYTPLSRIIPGFMTAIFRIYDKIKYQIPVLRYM
jgi:hypothetical protein